MRRLVVLFALFALPLFADEVLTNADVVKLVQAGLSPETIIAKIEATPARFDVSTDALVALTKDGVPDRVIRAMISSGAPPPSAAQEKSTAGGGGAPPKAKSRRYDVAVHRDEHVRCEDAELRVDGRGVKTSRCRGIDFELAWSAVKRVCYEYGFRGTIVFFTETGQHRVSTTTPAEAKAIIDHIRANAPALPVAACTGD